MGLTPGTDQREDSVDSHAEWEKYFLYSCIIKLILPIYYCCQFLCFVILFTGHKYSKQQ